MTYCARCGDTAESVVIDSQGERCLCGVCATCEWGNLIQPKLGEELYAMEREYAADSHHC